MFDGLHPWFWVTFAWLQLLVAYGGYLWYLRGRAQRLQRREEEER
ncbi:MAG: hypothetical protein WD336_01590 [Trueperaceae bacterium]